MAKNKLNTNTEIIAEIANAHQGNSELAKRIALEAIDNGADAIKFQIYFADELLINKHKKFNHFKSQSFSKNTWLKLLNFFKKKNINLYCDVFGKKAFEIANGSGVDGFKIHSSDLNNFNLLKLVSKTKKKIFISAGGSTLEEISYALNILRLTNERQLILLHGFQSYPTKLENCDLSKIHLYKKLFKNKLDIGYQDHLSADDPLNFKTPIIAMKLGAKYLEKHITIGRDKKGIDYYSSLEPYEFKKFVKYVRQNENKKNNNLGAILGKSNLNKALGEETLEKMSTSEISYRNTVKKVWFLNKNISRGKKINEKNIIMKRPDKLNSNNINLETFKNKKLKRNIKKDCQINNSMFKNDVTAIIVARNSSNRLKNKAVKKICDIYAIEHLIKRVQRSKEINRIILCTTKNKNDDLLIKIAKKNRVLSYRGSEKDVLHRMLGAIKKTKTNVIVRITGDDILIDPYFLDKTVKYHLLNNLQYTDAKKLPSGIDVEVFDRDFLETIYKLAKDTSGTEYLTYYVTNHKNQFRIGSLDVSNKYRKKIRLTLDNFKDFKVIKIFLEQMKKRKKLFDYKFEDLIKFYKKNKKIFSLNLNPSFKLKKINTDFIWTRLFN